MPDLKPDSALQSRVPMADYIQQDAVHSTGLKHLARSPLHYRWAKAHPRTSGPMTLGSAAHTAVLEPHRFLDSYCLWDERTPAGKVRPRTGKDYAAFLERNRGRRPLLRREFDLAQAMRDAVRSSPDAAPYLEAGDPEVVLLWTDAETALPCKGRLDWLTPERIVVGLKTAQDCRPVQFGNAAAKLGYPIQWSMYWDGYQEATGRPPAKMIEIVVESAPPHDVGVYRVPLDVIEKGREEYRRLMALLLECRTAGRWPGACPGEQDIILPAWTYQADPEDEPAITAGGEPMQF